MEIGCNIQATKCDQRLKRLGSQLKMQCVQMFRWLVGDMEWRLTDAIGLDGKVREQRSVAHIKKCRFLEASGCVTSCLNLCKAPTQAFFTQVGLQWHH